MSLRIIHWLWLIACWATQAVWAEAIPEGCLSAEPVRVVIRNDDVCALSQPEWEDRILAEFRHAGVPISVAMVPAIAADTRYRPEARRHPLWENRHIVALYRQALDEGWIDIVQHGLDHQQNRQHAGLPPAEASEFTGLPLEEQRQRILKGQRWIERAMGVKPVIFVPPWNNADVNTLNALTQAKFTGLSDTGLVRISGRHRERLPARMVDFDQLPTVLRQWAERGKCAGRLPRETVVVLYHSWSDYDPQGPQRLRERLALLKRSGVQVATLSQVLLEKAPSESALDGQLETRGAELQQQ